MLPEAAVERITSGKAAGRALNAAEATAVPPVPPIAKAPRRVPLAWRAATTARHDLLLAVTYRDEMLAGDHPVTVDKYGNMRSYDLQTNTFAAYNADGTIKTFFKPDEDQIEKYSNPFKGLS